MESTDLDTLTTADKEVHNNIIALLDREGVQYTRIVHGPCHTCEESAAIRNAPLTTGAKALLVGGNNEKYLLVLSAAKRVNWKPLDKVYGKLGPLAAEKAMEVSGCLIGAIPPFGSCLKTKGIKTIMDPSVQEQGSFIWFNAGLREVSVKMNVDDYIRLENPTIMRFSK
ncbi:hypothetical protein WA577_006281, partial [Blastocystis sp. JDR]